MSVDEAWADIKDWGKASTGRTDVVIAYIEGGINYNAGSQQELIPKVYLNCSGSMITDTELVG